MNNPSIDHQSLMTKKPLIVVVGETASGKSRFAIELAQKYNGEIICADSWTVRKEVTIGTAKPTPEEQKKVVHHLLDIVEPCDDFTAAVYKKQANDAIDRVIAKRKIPIMVGGSGLYIDGVIFDYNFLPEGDRKKRETLNEMSVHELINKIETAGLSTEGVDTRNKRRLIRVLETEGQKPKKHGLRQHTLVIGISVPSDELTQRIIDRIERMIDEGLEQEVASIAAKHGWGCEALKGIGYREWYAYFNGDQSLEQTKERIIASTRGLAKRQRTWFKRNHHIHWIDNNDQGTHIVSDWLVQQDVSV
jgi:tRNA dimethylallyltransferase